MKASGLYQVTKRVLTTNTTQCNIINWKLSNRAGVLVSESRVWPFLSSWVIADREKMRSSEWFLLAGNQNGIQPQKHFTNSPFSPWQEKQIGEIQPVVPQGQTHLPTRNRMVGNPAKLQDGVPIISMVTDLLLCMEADGDGRVLTMLQTA